MANDITDQNFEQEVKNFNGVALVDFWAPWCGPCKVQGPIVEELANEMQGNESVKVLKMNVDENQATSQAFGILSIPTLKIFKNGEVVEDFVGVQKKEDLAAALNKHAA